MKIFILALFGLLALVNAAPQITAPYKRPPPKRYENTKDKREANQEAWDLQEEDVYGEPPRAHPGPYPGFEQPAKIISKRGAQNYNAPKPAYIAPPPPTPKYITPKPVYRPAPKKSAYQHDPPKRLYSDS